MSYCLIDAYPDTGVFSGGGDPDAQDQRSWGLTVFRLFHGGCCCECGHSYGSGPK